jgi:hypothetical protein
VAVDYTSPKESQLGNILRCLSTWWEWATDVKNVSTSVTGFCPPRRCGRCDTKCVPPLFMAAATTRTSYRVPFVSFPFFPDEPRPQRVPLPPSIPPLSSAWRRVRDSIKRLNNLSSRRYPLQQPLRPVHLIAALGTPSRATSRARAVQRDFISLPMPMFLLRSCLRIYLPGHD